jgi:hypothetical protein
MMSVVFQVKDSLKGSDDAIPNSKVGELLIQDENIDIACIGHDALPRFMKECRFG